MVFAKPTSFTGAGHGAHSRPPSSLLWNGSTQKCTPIMFVLSGGLPCNSLTE